eukprot:TRINITY_DN7364_c0_g1_i2.p1 TRINITY_DN7364_c0_g1~~TRINITY_DN7364_c0_g1_i2.p1  ORF type:complete len:769 (-),score=274.54 TRINITY_DN7364_c0_g1_i2:58-2364(-)
MSIVLKVGFPAGIDLKTKSMKLKTGTSGKEVVDEIAKQVKLSNPEQYCILLPPPSPELNSVWIDDAKPLSAYPLQAKDYIELRRKYQVIRIRYRRGSQRILVHISQPLQTIFPSIAKKFQISEKLDDYSLIVRKTTLDLKKSIREQSTSTDAIYTLKNNKEEDIEIEDEFREEEEDTTMMKQFEDEEEEQKKEETPTDLNNVAAKDIKNPQKAGFVNLKQGRKKKFEQRWVILKNNNLFYYKTQNDKKPNGIINVDQLKLRPFEFVDEKEKKLKEYVHCFELFNVSPGGGGNGGEGTPNLNEEWIVKCENDNGVKSWMSSIEIVLGNAEKAAELAGPGFVFGAPLVKVASISTNKLQIPDIVDQCIKVISSKYLDVEGIFRLSGSIVQIEQYKKAFDAGDKVDLSKETDPHAITGLMKLYFRELPEPILTYDLYDQFIAAQSAPHQNLRLRYLKALIDTLPKINKSLLHHLISFLIRVNEHSGKNKMAIPNLATVFGPNLLGPPDKSTLTLVQDTPQINGIVNNLIQEYDAIFMNKEIGEKAVALYDYNAEDASEISFLEGQELKVISQGQDGWWSGEIDGKIGRFPGSYVKIEVKTKKQLFVEDMQNVKRKVEESTVLLSNLEQSKKQLEKEIQQMNLEKQAVESELGNLRSSILQITKEEKSVSNFLSKFEKYSNKMNELYKTKEKIESVNQNLQEEFGSVKMFFRNPGPDAKKSLKEKTQQKILKEMGSAAVSMNADSKKRHHVNLRLEDLHQDLSSLRELLGNN